MLPKKVLSGNARLPFPVLYLLLLFVSAGYCEAVKHRNHKNPSTDSTLRNVHESRRRAGPRDPAISGQVTCSKVKYAYSAKGFDDVDVPEEAISGDHLKICQQGLTCCTDEMEYKLSTHSRAEFDSLLKEAITEVRNVLSTRTQKFDEFFRELLKSSKKDFHQMFLQTYGLLYEKNSYIFSDLFQDLERYYMTGGVDLSEALDSFFQKLYQKMFEVLNAQYSFDGKYFQCISDHMDQLRPFGDVPKKLTIEVKRSFVATRTFVQALSNGKDVIKNVMEVGPALECSRALMRMTYCPHCQGLPDLKPCANYCLNVMKGCLAHQAELHKEWNNYIEALISLANRLETSFNIESVVDPIDIKISEAIMNFQENGMAVSQKLFESCGKPRIGKTRRKRGARGGGINFEKYKYGRPSSYPSMGHQTPTGTNMDRLVQDIKRKIKRTKGFWTKLPHILCSHRHVVGPFSGKPQSKDCWNGTGRATYETEVIGDGLINQKHNPEVSFDFSRQNSIITQQILTLKLITTKLNHAYNGFDVKWQDNSADNQWVSGEGSGSGLEAPDLEEDEGEGEDPSKSKDQVATNGGGDLYFSVPPPKTKQPSWPVVVTKVSRTGESARTRNPSANPRNTRGAAVRPEATISTTLWLTLLLSLLSLPFCDHINMGRYFNH